MYTIRKRTPKLKVTYGPAHPLHIDALTTVTCNLGRPCRALRASAGYPLRTGVPLAQRSNLTFGRHFLHDFVPEKDGSFCHDDNTRLLGPTAQALGCRYHRVTPEKDFEVLRPARTAPSHQPSIETLAFLVSHVPTMASLPPRCWWVGW